MKALSFAVTALFLAADPAGVRTWTDTTGQYTTQAEFVDFQDGIVRLRRTDNGEIRSIPLEKLSEADQQFVKSRMEPSGGTAAAEVDSVQQGDRGAAPAPGGALPTRLIERLKAATVLVKVRTRESTLSASGFLQKKEGGVGYVVSAYLVADSPDGGFSGGWPPQCVFHSGTKREQSTYARPVILDEQRHLAILRVELDTLPEPVALDAKVALRETLPVLIIGFPLGDMLRASERQPAVTISRASISSLRRDDDDRIALIQIEGGVNPGNSGGPVVDAQGRLIGIAVAKVAGTQIGMAIPAERVSEMLKRVYMEPGRFTVGLARPGVDVGAAAKPMEPAAGQRSSDVLGDGKPRQRVVEFSWIPPPINVITPPPETAVAGRIERESSGRRYTALAAKGVTLDLGQDVLQLVACPTGKAVYLIRRGEPVVTAVDPLTWKSLAEIVVPESPTSIWADATLIGVACDKSRVGTLIDA